MRLNKFFNNNQRRLTRNQQEYSRLEPRQLLAATSFNDATGELLIDFSGNQQSVIVDSLAGQVVIDGSIDVNDSLPGIQAVNVSQVLMITAKGHTNYSDQTLTLNGDYMFADGAQLTQMTFTDIDRLNVNGGYQLSGNLYASFSGKSGGVFDGPTGTLKVEGHTTLIAADNDVKLDSGNHDFVKSVFVSTAGIDRDVELTDVNLLRIRGASVTGNMTLTAQGDIVDSLGADIEVDGGGFFTAENVVIGEGPRSSTNFLRVSFDVNNHVEFQEDSSTIFVGDSRMGSALIESAGGIFDSRDSSISVDGLAQFYGDLRIRIGEHSTDTFNAGQLEVQSRGHVDIFEDSSTAIVGTNFAQSFDVTSLGDLTDADDASLQVVDQAGFEANNIVLGDTDSDSFNTGSIYFFTLGDMFVSEDSDMNIAESKNRSNRLHLSAKGVITDATAASIRVERLAMFEANSVTLGDTLDDDFNAGSISFNTSGQFAVSEDSGTNIAGFNSASSLLIDSSGLLANSNEARLRVETTAIFSANSIQLGNRVSDQFNFGSLTLNSQGSVTVKEDSSTFITGSNNVDSLNLSSTGMIVDANNASLNVNRIATFKAAAINIGDRATDRFNAFGITIQVTGVAKVQEDSSMILTGANFANRLSLTADGNVTDNRAGSIEVATLLEVTGELINLGDTDLDNVVFSTVTFNSTGNVMVRADRNFDIAGVNSAGLLSLKSTGNITDHEDADISVVQSASFTGIDIVIGDSATDCFLVDSGQAFVDALGINDVTQGC